jgi:hypothetical protein
MLRLDRSEFIVSLGNAAPVSLSHQACEIPGSYTFDGSAVVTIAPLLDTISRHFSGRKKALAKTTVRLPTCGSPSVIRTPHSKRRR